MDGESRDARVTATAERLKTILAEDGPGALTIAATCLRPADLAAAFEVLDEQQRGGVFLGLPPDVAGEVLEELSPELRDQLLHEHQLLLWREQRQHFAHQLLLEAQPALLDMQQVLQQPNHSDVLLPQLVHQRQPVLRELLVQQQLVQQLTLLQLPRTLPLHLQFLSLYLVEL